MAIRISKLIVATVSDTACLAQRWREGLFRTVSRMFRSAKAVVSRAVVSLVIRPGRRTRAPHTVAWGKSPAPIAVPSFRRTILYVIVGSFERHRIRKTNSFGKFRDGGDRRIGKVGALTVSRGRCVGVGGLTFMILWCEFILRSGRTTNEWRQSDARVVPNPLRGKRCTGSTGRRFTVNRGRQWKIGVVDLKDMISVRDGYLARGG